MLCGKMFIVFDHMILILNYMFSFVGLELIEKGINNHLTIVYQPIMNTLVHIVRFCARESVVHA